MSTFIIIQQMIVIAILVGIGFFLCKSGTIDDSVSKSLSSIVIDVCNPALILSCILTGDMNISHRELLVAIGIAFLLYALLCLLGFLIPKLIQIPSAEQKYYALMTVYGNIGFIGIPLARAVLSDTGMLYVVVMNIMFSLYFYTHGILTLGGKSEKIKMTQMFGPGTIMSIVALVVFWFHLPLPKILSDSVVYLGNATVFLSMSLLGASLSKTSFRTICREKRMWIYLPIRMILLPLLLAFTLRAFHFSEDMVQAFCLMVSMPAANMPLIQAEKTGKNTMLLSQGIMMTTVISFVTITLVMSIVF